MRALLNARQFSHAKARERFRAGENVRDIAKSLHVSRQSINSVLGIADRQEHAVAKSALRSLRDSTLRDLARRLRKDGLTIDSIRLKLGIGKDRVVRFCDGISVQLPPRTNAKRRATKSNVPAWITGSGLTEDYRDHKRVFGETDALRHCRKLAAEMRDGPQ